ncbi:MAG TPA: nitric oxide synthase oxygenase [Rugosimonospora sp.]|nr:nitric oxide synthase oxygenase [Rugosimonospora sp.]
MTADPDDPVAACPATPATVLPEDAGGVPGYRGTPARTWDPDAPTDVEEAQRFLELFHTERHTRARLLGRLEAVRAEIAATGTYRHTSEELAFGARVAWRNASRCIGRLYWQSLRVLDRRAVHGADAMFAALTSHLRQTAAGGGVRPTISIFAPARPGLPYARIWNEQLIRYAGYRQDDGTPVGDQRYLGFTAAVTALGWRGKGSAFDVLPLVIDTPAVGPRLFELPEDAVAEVPLIHPDHAWFTDLGLRWHVVPAISHMRLTIGGVHYPLAPFNGWYMGTEIGARNLADTDRYNMLPIIADRLGLDTRRDSTLWRDRALVELNVAVLYSFAAAGARISDHHTEAQRFCTHIIREAQAQRTVPADWTWIVPPMSGSLTPVFHRYYNEADLRPNFYLDPDAQELAIHGRPAAVPPVTPRR